MLLRGKSESGKIVERYWDTDGKMRIRTYEDAGRVERRLKFMDESGIDMAVLTPNPVSTLDQCRRWNDFCAGVVAEYPRRFAGFAAVPAFGGGAAMKELERATKGLGLKGVHIWTQVGGRTLDSRELWPFYEKVSELRIPVDVHVTLEPAGLDGLHAPYALYYVMARELDMCAATMRVCLGGVLEDFPDLVMIMNHYGGGVSAVMERLDAYMNYVGPGCPSLYREKALISKPWRHYFDKLYFNMAGREAGMAAVKAALTTISPSKLMFGTDWPFNFDHDPEGVRRFVSGIRDLELPREDAEAMLGGNAARLLGIGDP
jgi:predicted TIM-barrel fold metal-dependent hydrolase